VTTADQVASRTADAIASLDTPVRKHVAAFIVDISGFTAFAETIEPEILLGLLREFHAALGAAILGASGTVVNFAGDQAFVRASDVDSLPHLVKVLGQVASKAIGRRVELEGALVSNLRAHRFVHGNAQVDGRIVLFFYFQEADTGMMMLIPGVREEGEVARFHLTGGLTDPQKN